MGPLDKLGGERGLLDPRDKPGDDKKGVFGTPLSIAYGLWPESYSSYTFTSNSLACMGSAMTSFTTRSICMPREPFTRMRSP